MTGAAITYCTLAIFFAIFFLVVLISFLIYLSDSTLSNQEMTSFAFALSICLVPTTFFGIKTEKAYDINFAVAEKNIHYEKVQTPTDNVQVDVEMNFDPNALENSKK